jgi:hypothetical protein
VLLRLVYTPGSAFAAAAVPMLVATEQVKTALDKTKKRLLPLSSSGIGAAAWNAAAIGYVRAWRVTDGPSGTVRVW